MRIVLDDRAAAGACAAASKRRLRGWWTRESRQSSGGYSQKPLLLRYSQRTTPLPSSLSEQRLYNEQCTLSVAGSYAPKMNEATTQATGAVKTKQNKQTNKKVNAHVQPTENMKHTFLTPSGKKLTHIIHRQSQQRTWKRNLKTSSKSTCSFPPALPLCYMP